MQHFTGPSHPFATRRLIQNHCHHRTWNWQAWPSRERIELNAAIKDISKSSRGTFHSIRWTDSHTQVGLSMPRICLRILHAALLYHKASLGIRDLSGLRESRFTAVRSKSQDQEVGERIIVDDHPRAFSGLDHLDGSGNVIGSHLTDVRADYFRTFNGHPMVILQRCGQSGRARWSGWYDPYDIWLRFRLTTRVRHGCGNWRASVERR